MVPASVCRARRPWGGPGAGQECGNTDK